MAMVKRETKKSVIYEFDGFSKFYGAFVQDAMVGTFVVPKKYAPLVREGAELEDLIDMHKDRRYGIVLRGYRRVQ